MSPPRRVFTLAAAAGTAALVGWGQLTAALALHIVDPLAPFDTGSTAPDWAGQSIVLMWFAVAAVLVGAFVGRAVGGSGVDGAARRFWPPRVMIAVAAAVGALPLYWQVRRLARPLTGPFAEEAGSAVLIGIAVATCAAVPLMAQRALRRGMVVWLCWIWVAMLEITAARWPPTSADFPHDVVFVHPLSSLRAPTPAANGSFTDWAEALAPLGVCVVLAVWSGWRRERLAMLGAICGPLLTLAAIAILAPGTGEQGTGHSDLGQLIVVTVLGIPIAAAFVFLGSRLPRKVTDRKIVQDA